MQGFIIAATCVIVVLAIIWAICHWLVKPLIIEHSYVRQALAGSEVVFGVAVTWTATANDVFKRTSWSDVTARPLFAASVILVLIGSYVMAKILTQWNKDQDSLTLKALKQGNESLTHQRDVLRRVLTMTDQIVEKKMNRVKAWHKGRSQADTGGPLAVLDPKAQIYVILTALHAFWARLLDGGKRLRMGVYTPVDGHLRAIFSFDGTTERCFSGQSDAYMQINDPAGAQSVITKLYHSSEKISIIPNCAEAVKNGTFAYLRKDQEAYMKSLLVVKKVIVSLRSTDVLILSLDTDQDDFFKRDLALDFEWCCDTIMKRLEFELLLLAAISPT